MRKLDKEVESQKNWDIITSMQVVYGSLNFGQLCIKSIRSDKRGKSDNE